jgi:hypothetical protein
LSDTRSNWSRGISEEYADYYVLERRPVVKGSKYVFEVREIPGEESFTDFLKLVTIDHSKNVKVSSDNEGNIFTYSNPIVPESCSLNGSADCLSYIDTIGDKNFTGKNGDVMEFSFGELTQEQKENAKVILRSDACSLYMELEVLGEWGNMEKVRPTKYEIMPHELWGTNAYDISEYITDLSGDIKVRLRWTSGHKIDYLALDTSVQEIPVVNEYFVQAALKGNADITSALRNSDNNYVHLVSGEKFVVEFPFEEPTCEDCERDFMIVSEGYYVPVVYADYNSAEPLPENVAGTGTLILNPENNSVVSIILSGHAGKASDFEELYPIEALPLENRLVVFESGNGTVKIDSISLIVQDNDSGNEIELPSTNVFISEKNDFSYLTLTEGEFAEFSFESFPKDLQNKSVFLNVKGYYEYLEAPADSFADAPLYVCSTGLASMTVQEDLYPFNDGNSYKVWYDFNTASIPDGATVTDTNLQVYVNNIAAIDLCGIDVTKMANKGSTYSCDGGFYSAIGATGNYLTNDTSFLSLGPGYYYSLDLGTDADSDVESRLAADWFSVGFKITGSGCSELYSLASVESANDPVLVVIYTNPVPAAPSNPVVDYNSLYPLGSKLGDLNVSWTDNSGNETGFKVWRSTDNFVSDTVLVTTTDENVTSYEDNNSGNGLTDNTYWYKIGATNVFGDTNSSADSNKTIDRTNPSVPADFTAAPQTNSMNLSWTASNESSVYALERSSSGGSSFTPLSGIYNPGEYPGTPAWGVRSGSWAIVAGRAKESSSGTGLITVGFDQNSSGTYLYEVDVNHHGAFPSGVGVAFFMQNNALTGNYYRVGCNSVGEQCGFVKSGDSISLIDIALQNHQKLKVLYTPSTGVIKGFVDDLQFVDYTDPSPITSGDFAGVFKSGTIISVDDMKFFQLSSATCLTDVNANDTSASPYVTGTTIIADSNVQFTVSWDSMADNGVDYNYFMRAIDENVNESNLLQNSGFERGLESWTLSYGGAAPTATTATRYAGYKSLQITSGAGAENNIGQTVTVTAGNTYMLRFNAKYPSSDYSYYSKAWMQDSGAINANNNCGGVSTATTLSATGWTPYQILCTPSTTSLTVGFGLSDEGGTLNIDGIELYELESATVTSGIKEYWAKRKDSAGTLLESNLVSSPTTSSAFSGLDVNSQHCFVVISTDNAGNDSNYLWGDPDTICKYTLANTPSVLLVETPLVDSLDVVTQYIANGNPAATQYAIFAAWRIRRLENPFTMGQSYCCHRP